MQWSESSMEIGNKGHRNRVFKRLTKISIHAILVSANLVLAIREIIAVHLKGGKK